MSSATKRAVKSAIPAGATSVMDRSGRLVVPREVRERSGFLPGVKLLVSFHDGKIEIEPAPLEVTLEKRGVLRVAVAKTKIDKIDTDTVQSTIDSLRTRLR